MAREKAGFRDNLERLNELYPDKEALTPAEVAAYLGCTRQTVYRNIPRNALGRITKTDLARLVSV